MNRQKENPAGHESFLFKYRHIFIAAAIWILYLFVFFFIKAEIEPTHFIHSRIDDHIPFIRWFFIPYCLWFAYIFGTLAYFAVASKRDFLKLQTYLFVGMAVCYATYIIYPNAIDFRPQITQNDFISRMMRGMFSMEESTLVTPSIHVFNSIAIHISIAESEKTRHNKRIVVSSFILMLLICSSTVLIKQHSIIDVLWGIALAAALYIPIYGVEKIALRRKNSYAQKELDN